MSLEEIDEWDQDFLDEAIKCTDQIAASKQNPNPHLSFSPLLNRNPNVPSPSSRYIPTQHADPFSPSFPTNLGPCGGGKVTSASFGFSPPRELSQRVPDQIETSIVPFGGQVAAVSSLGPKNGGYGGGSKGRESELERLKRELRRVSKQLSIKEHECKELEKEKANKDEQIKVALSQIENKDAEICSLKNTSITHGFETINVQNDRLTAGVSDFNQNTVDNGLTSSTKISFQKKRSRTIGVQTNIVPDSGLSNENNMLHNEYDILSKLRGIWGFPGSRMGRNLISDLFATCSADFCELFKYMSFSSKTKLDSWSHGSHSEASNEGIQSPQEIDSAGTKVHRLYGILMKMRHEVVPLLTLLEALFDLCMLDNVVVVHKSLCILHSILQQLSFSSRLERRNNVLIDHARSSPLSQSIGQKEHNKSETSTARSFNLDKLGKNEDRFSRSSICLSSVALLIIFEKMQQIVLSSIEEIIQAEALSVMNLILMTSNPSERDKYGLTALLEGLPRLLHIKVGLSVRKEAVRLLFLLLNCQKMLEMFSHWQKDDSEQTKLAGSLIAKTTSQEGISSILVRLAECLVCAGASSQELKLRRDVIIILAFIASCGKSGFDALLYQATPQGENFLELIIRVLASETDREIADLAKSQEASKERTSLVREALILLNRLASNPSYSKATLGVLTGGAIARLTIDVANRMSRKSHSLRKQNGTKKFQMEAEIVDLARLFKARVCAFLGEK